MSSTKKNTTTSTGNTFTNKQATANSVINKFAPSYWEYIGMIALVVAIAALITIIDYSCIVSSLKDANLFRAWIEAIFALIILVSTITVAIYAVRTIWNRYKVELDEHREFVKQVRDKLMEEKLFE